MENNLYYTPEISEFHVGFEYEEYQFLERNWKIVKCEFIKPDTIIDPKWFRVKTLDQSDIESLGWLFKTKGPFRYWFEGNESWFNNTIPDSPSGRYWEFQLIFDPELHTVQISAKTNDGIQEYEPFFQGTIKNKSELIKLMQQLNIK